MSDRWTRCKLLLGFALVAGASACSPSIRHRVLTFFVDGVPEPGAELTVGYPVESHAIAGLPGPDVVLDTRVSRTRPRARTVYYAHPPYRENRCGSCHNPQDGQVQRSPEEGLCLTCHEELARKPTFLHGPVAVNACTFCHHHHASTYPKLLLVDPTVICFRCHEEDNLTTGPHHDTRAHDTGVHDTGVHDTRVHEDRSTQPCLQCHDPHGGGDRFFLKTFVSRPEHR